jgi:glycosidase
VQGDGKKRNNFPGGFRNSTQNKFSAAGRNEAEEKAIQHIKALANFRKTSAALTIGKTIDYLPVNGVYVYFRQQANETVMCILNTSNEDKQVKPADYAQTAKYTTAKDVVTGETHNLQGGWNVPKATMWVLSLQ